MATEFEATESYRTAAGSEPRRRILVRRLRLVAVVVLIGALGLLLPFPWEGRLSGNLFDLAHAPAFFVALLTVVGAVDPRAIGLSERFPTVLTMTWPRCLTVAGLLAAFGGIGEFLQKFAGRSPDLGDVGANVLGLLAALLWIASRAEATAKRWLLVAGSVAIFLAVSWNPVLEAWDSVQQSRTFPLLASFERPREIGAWLPHNARMERSAAWSSDRQHSARIIFTDGEYPGALMDWFPPDWRDFRSLQVEFNNPGDSPLRLVVKLFDVLHERNGFDHDDRFHREVLLPPGSDVSVEILLSAVKAAPANRQMQLGKMSAIDVFCPDAHPSGSFFIDHLRLAR